MQIGLTQSDTKRARILGDRRRKIWGKCSKLMALSEKVIFSWIILVLALKLVGGPNLIQKWCIEEKSSVPES